MDILKPRRHEIGSEFWSIPLSEKTNKCFSQNPTWFMSGRAALETIIADIKSKREVRSALLPSWCCDSMIVPFLKAGIEVRFYPVFVQNGILRQQIGDANECDILFLINYFGYTDGLVHHNCDAAVIRDVTHSIFSKTYTDADYYFGSLRKWCGFKTGGFAFGLEGVQLPPDNQYFSIRQSAMRAKSEYISGKTESKAFLTTFAQAEEYLEDCSAAGAESEEIALASKVDVDFLKTRRRKNASILLEELADLTLFSSVGDGDCPLFVPITVSENDRDPLRRHLIGNEIYSPVHWPISRYHKLDKQTERIYKGELSLVCDQRYDEYDMLRIVKVIKEYLKR